MRLITVLSILTVATSYAHCQEYPLQELTLTSTRLSSTSGFAEVTHAYKRCSSNADDLRLEFIVIEASGSYHFTSNVMLNHKVDDVTPPAYLNLEEWPIARPEAT